MSIAEADHRSLSQRLDLLHFQDDAPGMVFWHAPGFALYRLLEDAARQQARAHGYAEVRTPQILRRPIWEASGHWSHFQAGMFRVDDESCEAAVKPVSCPGHIQILKRKPPSYRDLPLRISELGIVHRDEPGGTLHGLLRLRQFTQDDGHVFCTPAQAEDEVLRFCRALPEFYAKFGFERVRWALSTRPADRAGSEAAWNSAEAALESALRALGVEYAVQPGAGAFYGPKIEFVLQDRLGRDWQCGTIQFDLVMPERFGLRYVAADGERKHPVMLHRALYGSLERFLGILLEHYGAALPAWLAPTQVVVLPVSPEEVSAAEQLHNELVQCGLRAVLNTEDSVARRIAEAHELAAPHVVLIGRRELAADQLTLRSRAGQAVLARSEAIAQLARDCAAPNFG